MPRQPITSRKASGKALVARGADPADRRARVVHLTDEGRALIECAFRDHAAAMEAAAGGLSPAERDAAVALLKKLGLSARERVHRVG